jgi:DNA-binding NtrC family response regulator
MPIQVPIVSNEASHWELLSEILLGRGLRPVWCESVAAAKMLLAEQVFGVVICEDLLPDGTFSDLIAAMKRSGPSIPVIVVSPLDDWGSFLDAMVAGAFDYIAFPPYPLELERAVTAALAETYTNAPAPVGATA